MLARGILAMSAALALPACASELRYDAAALTSATMRPPRPAQRADVVPFRISARDARGELDVASYGLVELVPPSGAERRPMAKSLAAHVRMIPKNRSEQAWTIDTREQRIDVDGYGASVPAFASADVGSAPPVVTVSPEGERTVDLFFPVPADLPNKPELPGFQATWRVRVGGGRTLDGRAAFATLAAEPLPPSRPSLSSAPHYGPNYDGVAHHPPYWVNPNYAGSGLLGVLLFPWLYFGGSFSVVPYAFRGDDFGRRRGSVVGRP